MRSNFRRAAIGLLLTCGLCSCSRIYLQTSPFSGEPEARVDARQNPPAGTIPSATRVNGWPLYYQRGANLSVLWPFFQQDGKGFALWPLFESYADPYRKIFALLYLLGIEWDSAGYRSSYFAPFWIDPKGRNFFSVVNARSVVDNRHYVSWLWLLHFWNAPDWHAHLILPFYYYYQRRAGDEWQLNTLLVNLWRSASKSVTNIGGFLFHHANDGGERYTALLWPLLNFWSGAQSGGQLILPVYYYYQTPEVRRFHSLLYSKYESAEEKYLNIGGLLYHHAESKLEPAESYSTWLWPLVQHWLSTEEAAVLTIPIYYYSWNIHGDWSFYSLLYNRRKSAEESLLNFGGPLFYQSKSENGDFLRTLLWPLFISSRTGAISKLLLLPLCYQRADAQNAAKTVITPLGGLSRAGDGSGFLNILGILYHHSFEPQINRFFKMFTPLVALWRNAPQGGFDRGGHWVLPFYAFWRHEQKNYWFHSLPYSQWRDGDQRGWAGLLGALCDVHRRPQYLNWGILLHLIHFTRYADQQDDWEFVVQPVIPMLEIQRDRLFTPLFGWRRPKSEEKLREELTRQLEHQRESAQEQEQPPPPPSYSAYTYDQSGWHFLPVVYQRSKMYRVESARSFEEQFRAPDIGRFFTLFPLYFSTLEHGVEKSHLLWIIWRSKKDTVESGGEQVRRVRRQLLWRVYDYERVGGVTSVDVFPFITYDRDRERDYLNYSFLGPVFRRVKSGTQGNWQILGLRLGPKIEYRQHPAAPAEE